MPLGGHSHIKRSPSGPDTGRNSTVRPTVRPHGGDVAVAAANVRVLSRDAALAVTARRAARALLTQVEVC